jgi:hypothetical protein
MYDVQKISVGVSELVVWLCLWSMFSLVGVSQFVSYVVDVLNKN